MEGLTAGNLRIDVNLDKNRRVLEVVWKGSSDDRQPGRALDPFFSQLLTSAAQQKLEVEMHFQGVEYFNSATIGTIVQLIKDARALSTRLSVIYNPQHRWQDTSFRAMRAFEKEDGLILFKPR